MYERTHIHAGPDTHAGAQVHTHCHSTTHTQPPVFESLSVPLEDIPGETWTGCKARAYRVDGTRKPRGQGLPDPFQAGSSGGRSRTWAQDRQQVAV